MNTQLYPLKFNPIIKEKIWGGQRLKTHLNKHSDLPNIGESWELSDIDGNISVVANGSLKGKSLKELLIDFTSDLVGKKNFSQFRTKFPLLIKFIDAQENLSVQLHPNSKLAAERHNSFGKTEMWYVMGADPGSELIVGFNQEVDSSKYLKHLENKTLTEILNFHKVKKGDTYFIEAGRIHAIGAGVMLAEIQQTSDITYRVYDWDRKDDGGKTRDLHSDLAVDAIDFNMPDNFRVTYSKEKNMSNNIVSCPYFTTNYVDINSNVEKVNTNDSFMIYMCVDGNAVIDTGNFSESIVKGETVLIPACIKQYKIESKSAKLLEIYV